MRPGTIIKGFDKGRLRGLLAFFFIALAVPTGALIWQAYGQLKWEAFHQYRGLAEELTTRIDARLIDMIHSADARSFADYTFLVVTGDPSANFLQRSPLSAYPVQKDVPGIVGYFQVDTDGDFSTPLLPPEDNDPRQLGIGADEYTNRLQLALKIHTVLADNRLVQSRSDTRLRLALKPDPETPKAGLETEKESDEFASPGSRGLRRAAESVPRVSAEQISGTSAAVEAGTVGGFMDASSETKDAIDKLEAALRENGAISNEGYSQQVFDQLNQPRQDTPSSSGSGGTPDLDAALGDIVKAQQRANTIGKVADLKLDSAYQKKSEDFEREENNKQRQDDGRTYAPHREKRRELITLPQTTSPADKRPAAAITGPIDLRISTFESEIDPFEFSLLDSGYFVLYRKVWREGERYIQGLLIDQNAFIEDVIGAGFMETALADMSDLIVANQDDVIHTFSGRDTVSYSNGNQALDGVLLYRTRLSAPLDSLELIFSIKRLPPGPGASVLGWITIIIALVFLGGFYALYRLGLSQINLARQQQDFVSAVSHELKTPLTSIRMYGEMLKEGWADEEKRKTYYEYIHDESERLSRLISNVLQLAKITRNEPQFDLKPIEVGSLMGNIESKISNQVERAGFELRFKRGDGADQATIMVDEDCFAQIIINLVDNAIKFSKGADNKTIEIDAKQSKDNHVIFSVRDYGPGIPKDQMKKIFKLFYRSESELTRETVGTGIGLAIVHQLTMAMDGKVDVINKEPGAEFSVAFAIS